MFDKCVSNRMTSCHDPYKELELYLEQAQEEIGKAVKELEWHEEVTLSEQSESESINDTFTTLLPPPEAFRTANSHGKSHFGEPRLAYPASTINSVNRLCHAGNLVHVKTSDKQSLPEKHTSSTAFSSSLSPGSLGRCTKSCYSPKTRRRLWQMHPSISFPETSKDLLLIGKNRDLPSYPYGSSSVPDKYKTHTSDHDTKSLTFDSYNGTVRRRSSSDSSDPNTHSKNSENTLVIPRPPSGDVNLLSVWANNLVLELDKTLNEELFSTSSVSPSSDYSLSPTKVDDALESADALHIPRTDLVDGCRVSSLERRSKLTSMSPDSGIEQLSCATPDMIDESCSRLKDKADVRNCNLIFPNQDLIASPPLEFGDRAIKPQNVSDKCRAFKSISSFADEKKPRSPNLLCTSAPVLEVEELSEISQDMQSQDIRSLARVIAPKTVELQDCSVTRTVCALNDVSSSLEQTADKLSNLKGRCIKSLKTDRGYHTISCMPESEKIANKDSDKWSCTLPRDSEKNVDPASFQRSVSHSAVFTMDPVSISELSAFITRLKSTSIQPPSCADVSTEVKEDSANKDAVTQTTPVPLSRSSSFTWITECDCSDWDLPNANSESDDNCRTNCTGCQTENQNRKSSSSSSLGASSDEDECMPTTPGSDSSSLYLSACSGSSDSFEETSHVIDECDDVTQHYEQPTDCDSFLPYRRSLRSSEATLRGSTLGDISEEQMTMDNVSVKSTLSNPSFSNSSTGEQCSSFPSTLKVVRRNKHSGIPSQPIEPTILIMNDLNLKSVSAPVLLRPKRHTSCSEVPESSSSDSSLPSEAKNSNSLDSNQVPTRSQSAKELNELQAIEACSWLRAAGFPQYAQMYEDNQFPIDISIVQKDHAFLPPDSIQSLFRRLNTLNRCANMKFADHSRKKSLHVEDSDEEEQYALSENWEFQRSSRRWSRISAASDCVNLNQPETNKPSNIFAISGRKYLSPEEIYCSSHDSVFVDEPHSSPDSSVLKPDRIYCSPSQTGDFSPVSSSGSGGTLSLASEDMHERRSLRRTGSDRVKEGAKALLKRMESLKGKKKKKNRESKKVESSVHHSGSSSSSLTSSPQLHRSDRVADTTLDVKIRDNRKQETGLSKNGAHSDSECRTILVSDANKDAGDFKSLKQSHTSFALTSESTIKSDSSHKKTYLKTDMSNQLLHPNYGTQQEFGNYDKRGSYYDNICAPIVVFNDFCTESLDRTPTRSCDEKQLTLTNQETSENQDDGEIIVINNERRDSGVGSSLTRGIQCIYAPWHCFSSVSLSEIKCYSSPMKITDLTSSQMLLLRKLSLLKLTALMERFSPSSRTGWSWAVPKFIRRIRNPDYKDKVVFGVPLLLTLQRTGQPLPRPIQNAIHHLRKTALDSTGLFRKSGVRSRIQKLKSLNESNPESINYDEQQSYDIADMLKQYFRELPEALLTNKLSETFIGIFQFIPENLRLEAVQVALMLMPDENREVLQALLEFLSEVCENSGINQMTATNLAVCFAPSLFHLSSPRSASSSPRRRKTVGVPDLKDLNENRAAYECLSCMISNYKTLFSVSEEMVSQGRILSATHSQPTSLEEISSFMYGGHIGLKGYFDSCVQMLLKETKEKYKSFLTVGQNDHVELSYKKLSDGNPLRLWKVSTEVEAPPSELLNRILRERHLWDPSFNKSKIVSRLNSNMEIFQYSTSSLPPHPPCDYCVLRAWRADLPKGACVLIETSVNHPDAEIHPGSVRALILASRYLIEPCGSGKSRITHLCRVDTRGRSPEWYNRAYGHICTLLLIKLRNSFSYARADGPETKV